MKSCYVSGVCLSILFAFIFATSPSASAAPSDACSLLTAGQVSKVLGISVKSGERIVASSPKMCGWAGAGGPANSKRAVLAILTPDMFDREKTPMRGITKTQAPGIGDDAHFITTPGFGTGLSIKKGGFVFKIRIYGFPIDAVKQKEGELARDVLANL